MTISNLSRVDAVAEFVARRIESRDPELRLARMIEESTDVLRRHQPLALRIRMPDGRERRT